MLETVSIGAANSVTLNRRLEELHSIPHSDDKINDESFNLAWPMRIFSNTSLSPQSFQ